MNRADLDIYRKHYQGSPLADIWDKITHVLEERGMCPAAAEHIGLRITEWIRTTWGGLILVERHIGDAREVNRFDQLRDRALNLLAEAAPDMANHGAVSVEIMRVVRVDYRGKYITKVKKLDQLQRDQEIWQKGNSAAQMEQLALERGLSLVRIYQINREMQLDRDKREQPLLPFG